MHKIVFESSWRKCCHNECDGIKHFNILVFTTKVTEGRHQKEGRFLQIAITYEFGFKHSFHTLALTFQQRKSTTSREKNDVGNLKLNFSNWQLGRFKRRMQCNAWLEGIILGSRFVWDRPCHSEGMVGMSCFVLTVNQIIMSDTINIL